MITSLCKTTVILSAILIAASVGAAPIKESKPLTPETILKNKFEGKATVEFTVGEVKTLNFDSVFMPGLADILILQAKLDGDFGAQDFCVIVDRETATRLLKLGIEDQVKHFKGKFVRVTGTVGRSERPDPESKIRNAVHTTTQIRVTSLDQLELIKKP